MNSLIAYFSRAGKNYVKGDIVDLPVGNTAIIAQEIKELTGGDLFQIRTKVDYPADYRQTTEVAREELNNDARPELAEKLDSLADYDVIYLGYPNWCGTMPMAVFAFIESYDVTGKIIVPFCTHEGSGFGGCIYDLQRICAQAEVLSGIEIRGSEVNTPATKQRLKNYLETISLIK